MTSASRLVFVAVAALCLVVPGALAIAQQETADFVQGVEKYQRGEYEDAAADLTRVVEAHADWEAAWYYLGVARFESVYQSLAGSKDRAARDYTEAQQALGRALELAPSRPGVRN